MSGAPFVSRIDARGGARPRLPVGNQHALRADAEKAFDQPASLLASLTIAYTG